MPRIISLTAALSFTLAATTGIAALIAMDFVGEETAIGWLSRIGSDESSGPGAASSEQAKVAVESIPALDGAEDITFFKEVPLPGLPFSITTGVRYANPLALAANTVASRWCYVMQMAPDGVGRRIDLAEQTGATDPVFNVLADLPEDQLALFKLSKMALEAAARAYCAFDFEMHGAD